MVPQATRPATITRHTAPVRLRLNAVQGNVEPNGGKSTKFTQQTSSISDR